ncbi:MAG: hypothetical protein HQ478_15250 [Chloroflexi bacterium]|nr:hypothetical protein [Chloroflexota bacterium]
MDESATHAFQVGLEVSGILLGVLMAVFSSYLSIMISSLLLTLANLNFGPGIRIRFEYKRYVGDPPSMLSVASLRFNGILLVVVSTAFFLTDVLIGTSAEF